MDRRERGRVPRLPTMLRTACYDGAVANAVIGSVHTPHTGATTSLPLLRATGAPGSGARQNKLKIILSLSNLFLLRCAA